MSTKKKARTEPAKSGCCGRITVPIATLDTDVEPDDCMLREKLRLIALAGIDTKDPVLVCGCAESEEKIPRDVLRALRVLVRKNQS